MEMTQQWNLQSVVGNFKIEGEFLNASRHGHGHIHDSFRVQTLDANTPNYLLQKINHQVFENVSELMANIECVSRHVRRKLNESPDASSAEEFLTLIPTRRGKSYFRDHDESYWRLWVFVADSYSHDIVSSPESAYEAGKAFGRFLALVSDLPVETLDTTIPDFHNIESRLKAFSGAVKANSVGRAEEVAEEIDLVETRSDEMKQILRLERAAQIPERITHNDTKINNVLFNAVGTAICVIDLDTVMPGYVHYDFGDGVRTVANQGAEDEEDLNKVELDIELFEAFSKGYLENTNQVLTQTEVDTLALSAKLMTFIMGVRFLTDYLVGDKYYKTQSPKHNLRRARAQFQLLTSMDQHYGEMKAIIKAIALQ